MLFEAGVGEKEWKGTLLVSLRVGFMGETFGVLQFQIHQICSDTNDLCSIMTI